MIGRAVALILALGLVAAPLVAEAQQQTGKVYRIGYLYRGSKIDVVAIPGYLPPSSRVCGDSDTSRGKT